MLNVEESTNIFFISVSKNISTSCKNRKTFNYFINVDFNITNFKKMSKIILSYQFYC